MVTMKSLFKEVYGMYNINNIWDSIIEYGIATDEELHLVTCINGYNKETLYVVVYVRTGYRSIEQFFEG